MSGGVDSSVAAVLLKEAGYAVTGITMCLGVKQEAAKPRCCGAAAIEDAKMVCQRLRIPHYIMDFSGDLENRIIAKFVDEYLQAKTPNPCIDCNRYLKFGALLEKVISLDFDFLATGHYARIERQEPAAGYSLKKGIDTKKEQSYVLYALTQDKFRRLLMPLGDYTKAQVRQIAQAQSLSIADKPESQEICFIPDDNYPEFIKERLKEGFAEAIKPGPIIDKHGQVLGEHQGIIFYTVGQRKRIGIANSEPLYVTAIDKENNAIVVGGKEDAYADELIADKAHFIDAQGLKEPVEAEVKIRYLHPPADAMVIPEAGDRVRIRFKQPQWAITPGQAAVFYQKDTLLGGGTITNFGDGSL